MSAFIKHFAAISYTDIAQVGGKNASLGEMFSQLTPKGILVPDGFAITANAYQSYITFNNLQQPLNTVLGQLDKNTFSNLHETGSMARSMIMKATMPPGIIREIEAAYHDLCTRAGKPVAVAVRSSATAEDLPAASFAGQLESFLNIRNTEELIVAVQRCFTSLFTNRAIK